MSEPAVRAPAGPATDDAVANMEGIAALPRRNGELVFEAPWEGRAFGIAVALNATGRYDWEVFRQQLIAEIDASEPDDGTGYYVRWLATLEAVLGREGLLNEQEIEARAGQLATRDAHEHDHDHHHEHEHNAHQAAGSSRREGVT